MSLICFSLNQNIQIFMHHLNCDHQLTRYTLMNTFILGENTAVFRRELAYLLCFSCLNFWDKAWWFLSLMVVGLLSSSLLLFPQHFGWYVLRSSSGICRTWESTLNFELCALLNPRGSPVLIPLAITRYKC